MADLTETTQTSSCCSPEAQETCCDPSEKAACCEQSAVGLTCGCSAGKTPEAEFVKGYMEDMPLADASVDVVISNCVINLSSDKPKASPKPPACSAEGADSPPPT